MAGEEKQAVRAVWAVVVCAAILVLGGCGGGEPPPDNCVNETSADVRRQVLSNLGENQIFPALQAFEGAATALEAATAAYASDRSAENLTAAQGAWIAAMDAWQVLEVFQLGPIAPSVVPDHYRCPCLSEPCSRGSPDSPDPPATTATLPASSNGPWPPKRTSLIRFPHPSSIKRVATGCTRCRPGKISVDQR